jgi:hypothetical protein
LLVLVVLSLGLCVPSATADPATTPVTFKPYAFGYVRDGFLGATQPRNRVLIGRTRAQALRWDKWINTRATAVPQYADFHSQALIGVFLVDHPARAVEGVAVRSLAISGGTLLLKLEVSRYPPVLRGSWFESPIEYWALPPAPSARYHAFTIVTVAKVAAARVRRVVVTQEVYAVDDFLVVDVPVLPGGG